MDDPDVAAVARISSVPATLRVIGQTTGLRLALVARVTNEMWKACAVLDRMSFGLEPGGLLDVATTLCSEVRDSRKPVVIEHASKDPVYCAHRTSKIYKFESYIAVPIFKKSGEYFGNLCALDSRPMPLKQGETLAMMELYAELIGLQLEAEEQHASMQTALLDARQTAELREQFIAVLGHDIRTPLSAIMTGSDLLLERNQLAASDQKVVERIRGSAGRIGRMVDDVLDFARGRLGGGIPLEHGVITDLTVVFHQVMEEARATHPRRSIHFYCAPCPPFRGDRGRLGQLLSNLLINALQHSPLESAVQVDVSVAQGELLLRVNNRSEPLSEDVLKRLFQPFSRGGGKTTQGGLGLGLYIAAEIVRSHGGKIDVRSSNAEGTTFVCHLPMR